MINSIIGHWKLDEAIGSIAYDSTTNANNGTIVGTTVEPGVLGGSRVFYSSSSDRVEIGTSTLFSFGTQPFSMAVWIKKSSSPAQAQGIISKWDATTGNKAWRLIVKTDGTISFDISTDGYAETTMVGTSPLSLCDNEWHLIAVTRNGTTYRLYTDGALASVYIFGAATINNASSSMAIGSYSGSSTWSNSFDGYIDNAKIFNYTLNDLDVSNLYYDFGYDSLPPWFVPIDPLPGQIRIDPSTDVSFLYLDEHTNLDTLNVTYNEQKVLLAGMPWDGYSVSYTRRYDGYDDGYDGYLVTIHGLDLLPERTQINVEIDAADAYGLVGAYTYYFWTSSSYDPPPTFVNFNPLPNSVMVNSGSVFFQFNDGYEVGVDLVSGANLATLQVTINGATVVHDGVIQSGYHGTIISNSYNGYDVTLYKDGYWDLAKTLFVSMSGSDNNGSSSSFAYQIKMSGGPLITNVIPTNSSIEVDRNTLVYFEMYDSVYGIDKEELNVIINGQAAIISSVAVNGHTVLYGMQPDGYIVQIGHPQWPEYTTMSAVISLYNRVGTFVSYTSSYRTADTSSPIIDQLTPYDGEEIISLLQNINFRIRDLKSKINYSTLNVTLDGQDVIVDGLQQSGYTVEVVTVTDGYVVSIDKNIPLQNNTQYGVNISVSDNEDNNSNLIYNFSTANLFMPVFTDIMPANLSVDVPTSTQLKFSIFDFVEAGINLDSLDVSIAGLQAVENGLQQDGYILEETHQTYDGYIGLDGYDGYDGYNITITMPSNLPQFAEIDVVMFGCNNNALCTTKNVSFRTADESAPQFINFSPPWPGAKVGLTQIITFSIIETLSGLDFATLNVYVDNIAAHIDGIAQGNGYDVIFIPQSYGCDVSITCSGQRRHQEFALIPVYVSISDNSGNIGSTTFYFHTTDITPPVFDNFSPFGGETRVNINTNFAFDFKDAHSGPDISSLQVTINARPVIVDGVGVDSNIVTYTPIGDGYLDGYRVEIDLDYPLPEYRNIIAEISGYDLDPNFTQTILQFSTDDVTPPSLNNMYPYDGATEVNPYATVAFDLYDVDGSGLDFSSVSVDIDNRHAMINGTTQDEWETVLTPIDGYYDGYRYEFISDRRFALDSDIVISITSADAYGNNIVQGFSFHTFKDTVAPIITPIDPLADATEISVYSDVQFSITDGYDVDINALDVYIDGTQAVINGEFQAGYQGQRSKITQIVDGYNISIDVNSRFEYNHTTNIHVDGYDPYGNHESYDYVFYTTTDSQAPAIINKVPGVSETNVGALSDVYFDITDLVSDVDIDKLHVYIDYNAAIIDGTFQSGWAGPNSSISRITDGYHIRIDPEGINNFDYNQTHEITIDGYDYAYNHIHDVYSFETVIDHVDPVIDNLVPYAGEIEVPVLSHIAFDITDNISGIDLSKLLVNINGISAYSGGTIQQPFDDDASSVVQILDGYRITFDNRLRFDYAQTVTVKVDGYDHADNKYSYTYFFITKVDVDGPTITDAQPVNGTINYPRDATITLLVQDEETGVDRNQINVAIDGTLVVQNGLLTDGYDDTQSFIVRMLDGYEICVHREIKWPAGKLLIVEADAYDFVGNGTNYVYEFTTVDDMPPYVFNFNPYIVSVNVTTNPLYIQFGIKDEGFNTVDLSSLVVEAAIDDGAFTHVYDPVNEYENGWYGAISNQPDGDGYIFAAYFSGEQSSYKLYSIRITASDNKNNTTTIVIGKSGGRIADGTGTISGTNSITVGSQFIGDNDIDVDDILIIHGVGAYLVDGYTSTDITTATTIDGSGTKNVTVLRGAFLTDRREFIPLSAESISPKEILVTFSEPVVYIGSQSDYIITGGAEPLLVINVVRHNDYTVKLTTDGGAQPLVEYLLHINDNVMNEWEFSLEDGYQDIMFSGFPDIYQPRVIDATVSPFNINITVLFDDSMYQNDVLAKPSTYRLSHGAYVTNVYTDANKKNQVILTVEGLFGHEIFDLYVDTAVMDIFGNYLDVRYNHATISLNQTAAGFSGMSGKLKTRDEVNRLYEDSRYWYIATVGGLDIIRKIDHINEGFVLDGYGIKAITAIDGYIYFDMLDGYVDASHATVYKLSFENLDSNSTQKVEAAFGYPDIQLAKINDLHSAYCGATQVIAIATDAGASIIFGTKILNCSNGNVIGSIFVDDGGTKVYVVNNTAGQIEVYYDIDIAPSGTIYAGTIYNTTTSPRVSSDIIKQIKVTYNTSEIDGESNTIYIATSNFVTKIETDESIPGASESNGVSYTYGIYGSGASYEILGGQTNEVIAIDINIKQLQVFVLTNNSEGEGGLTIINLPSNARFSYSCYENGTLISTRLRDVVAKT